MTPSRAHLQLKPFIDGQMKIPSAHSYALGVNGVWASKHTYATGLLRAAEERAGWASVPLDSMDVAGLDARGKILWEQPLVEPIPSVLRRFKAMSERQVVLTEDTEVELDVDFPGDMDEHSPEGRDFLKAAFRAAYSADQFGPPPEQQAHPISYGDYVFAEARRSVDHASVVFTQFKGVALKEEKQ